MGANGVVMKLLGLTGSIGMGKSTTAKLFAEAGVPVYDADATVHRIYQGEAVPAIEAAFPGTTADGKVDRAKLSAPGGARYRCDQAARADSASDAADLSPEIPRRRGSLRRAGCGGRCAAAVETGGEERVDAVVVVTTSPETQRERILARGTMTNEVLDSILARQMPDAEKRARADFVVDTSHGLEPVRAAIRDILQEVAKMPRRRP